jgi:hypothetical protein
MSIEEFELANGLPEKYLDELKTRGATPEIVDFMQKFPPWGFYTDKLTEKTPLRILATDEYAVDVCCLTVTKAKDDDKYYIHFRSTYAPAELMSVDQWSEEQMSMINKLEHESHRKLFLDRMGFVQASLCLESVERSLRGEEE